MDIVCESGSAHKSVLPPMHVLGGNTNIVELPDRDGDGVETSVKLGQGERQVNGVRADRESAAHQLPARRLEQSSVKRPGASCQRCGPQLGEAAQRPERVPAAERRRSRHTVLRTLAATWPIACGPPPV